MVIYVVQFNKVSDKSHFMFLSITWKIEKYFESFTQYIVYYYTKMITFLINFESFSIIKPKQNLRIRFNNY